MFRAYVLDVTKKYGNWIYVSKNVSLRSMAIRYMFRKMWDMQRFLIQNMIQLNSLYFVGFYKNWLEFDTIKTRAAQRVEFRTLGTYYPNFLRSISHERSDLSWGLCLELSEGA